MTWAKRLMVLSAVLIVSTTSSSRTMQAQQPPPPAPSGPTPPGYLGPMQPIPTGPASPEAPGSLEPPAGPTLPNVRVNDKVDDAPDQSQSETTIGVDPTNPLRLIGGFNDCRGFFFPSRNGISGWGYSTDGGATWTGVQAGLPKAASNDFGTRGDPSVDVDADGNFYYASLYTQAGNPALNVSVHSGKFSGSSLAWNAPTFATNFTGGFGADKGFLGVDHRPGVHTVYVSYTNFSAGGNGQIEVVRSTDGGRTWGAPVVIAPASATVHQGSLPRVGPDGEVYVLWSDGFTTSTQSLHIRKSTSWPNFSPDTLVSNVTVASNPPFNSRNPQFPTMDIDRTSGPNRGRVYVSWFDGRFGGPGAVSAILLSHSADGTSWSAPVMVNDDGQPSSTGTYHWFPWLSVDARGTANLGWYDRRLRGTQPALTDVFAAQFTPAGGVSANQRLTSQSFSMNVPSRCTPNFGDYNGATTGPTTFHFLYGDGREGNPDTYAAGVVNSPILANPSSVETCHAAPVTTTITVLGGQGLFQNNVTLSLMSVSPQPPPGGEITAQFVPNPVPAPPPTGSTSTMTITGTASTPPGVYTLTVKGDDGARSFTTAVSLTVRSQSPDTPNPLTPPNGSDGVLETPTFTWSAAQQTTSYRVQVFPSADCSASPVRDFDNIGGTSFTVPQSQALPFFQTFSWRVTAKNSCGTSSDGQCFNFRTRSCVATAHDVAMNGGFEQGLTGWVVDASTPKPLVVPDQHHSGQYSLRLGVIAESGSNTDPGDSEVHQTFTIPATAMAPRLTYWFYGQSSEFSIQNDQQQAFVVPIAPPGPPVLLMNELSNQRTFISRSFDLSAFAGKTIEIHFRAHNNGDSQPTGMYVDDVSVTFTSCGAPDFFLTSAAPSFNEVCSGDSLGFTVGVQSLNGPNFTSPVTLSAANLPDGATATFADNPILPGTTTTMTLSTSPPAGGGRAFFSIVGTAVDGPPFDPRTTTTDTTIDSNAPGVPEQIAPHSGQVNVPRRPTLSWTEPFVPPAGGIAVLAGGNAPPTREDIFNLPPERQAANDPFADPDPDGPAGSRRSAAAPGRLGAAGAGSVGATGGNGAGFGPAASGSFGAARYRVQVATDSEFAFKIVDTETPDTMFTVPSDLEAASQYFWRVSASNACGASTFSSGGSFITGACFEGWSVNPPIPITTGPAQSSAVAVGGKIYVIGGGLGGGPDTRTNQVWAFDPAAGTWARKADVPTPGPGSTYGSAAEVGGKIYVFGGVSGPPGPITFLPTLWIYDVAADTWTRGRDMPNSSSGNFGIAVAAVGSRIILAGGSAFNNQTWQYDPATNSYTRLADAPSFQFRVHAGAVGNEVHAVASLTGQTHLIYNAATDSWRSGPPLPFFVVDPAVGVIGGKVYVVGGRPIARTQIFDPATNTWSQGPALPGLPTGLDNTSGAVTGGKMYVVGGFDGANGTNAHRVFTICGPDSAQYVFPAVDGDGSVPGIAAERTALILSNDRSIGPVSGTVFFSTPDGRVDSSDVFTLAPRESRTLPDVIRLLRGAEGVQNVEGSLSILATQSIDAVAVVTNNATNDSVVIGGQRLSGIRNGFVPRIELTDSSRTQVVINNASAQETSVQLLAFPPEGGDQPAISTSVDIAARGVLDVPDMVGALGLPAGFAGQLTWNSTQPVDVVARRQTPDGFSGDLPTHDIADGGNSLVVGYVEDTDAFLTDLQLNNNGPFTANVTVQFFDISDASGGTPGDVFSRDIPVPRNSAMSIANVVRWALSSDDGDPTGKRGFLVISSPQRVTGFASMTNTTSGDPAFSDAVSAGRASFTPLVIRTAGDAGAQVASRVAIVNPDGGVANVDVAIFNPDGTPALAPARIQVTGGGQFFTDDLVAELGLPVTFSGTMTLSADVPVVLFNQESADDGTGATVPVRPR